DHGAPGETCAGSRLQGGNADGLVRDEMKQHGEALELLLEQLADRLGRHVAPREPRAPGADDHVHIAVPDPAAQPLLDVCLAVFHQRARREPMARGTDALGEQVAGGVGPRIARIGNREDRKSTRLNSSHVAISYAVFCLKKKKKKTKKINITRMYNQEDIREYV